jgi:hypothetical protein
MPNSCPNLTFQNKNDMKKVLTFICLIAMPIIAFSQSNPILGSWIKTKMETYDKRVTPAIEARNANFFKYTFERDEKVYFSLTQNEKGNENRYKIKNNIIDFGFNKMKIESIDSVNLVVIELEDNQITNNSTRIYFTKEQAFLDELPMEKEGFYVANQDTVFFENNKIYPIFKHKTISDAKTFIQPFVEGLSKDKEAYALITFVLNTDGKISDIKMHHHINKGYDKNVVKAILKTEGSWVSPIVNGKKVNVLKEIEFAYLSPAGMSTDEFKANPINYTHKNDIFSKKYREMFKNAVKLTYRQEYKNALDVYAKCLELTTDNSNIDYQKSICFALLNDMPNSNLSIEAVKKSNLKYLINDKK